MTGHCVANRGGEIWIRNNLGLIYGKAQISGFLTGSILNNTIFDCRDIDSRLDNCVWRASRIVGFPWPFERRRIADVLLVYIFLQIRASY